MAMVNPMMNVKDSRWLTLEVCREFQRNKCTRPDTECKFAHPPAHVEVQNGRVTCCFDSIKGKCQRKDPPCKYLHPPQHLREQLLQNGKNNLILKNLQMQVASAYSGLAAPMIPTGMIPFAYDASCKGYTSMVPNQFTANYGWRPDHSSTTTTSSTTDSQLTRSSTTVMPTYVDSYRSQRVAPSLESYIYPGSAHPYLNPTAVPTAAFNPYISSGLPTMPGMVPTSESGQVGQATQLATVAVPTPTGGIAQQTKVQRTDRLETPVVEVMKGKKRTLDPSDELILGMSVPGMMPYMKRPAMADAKSGLPVYQPNSGMAAYQQALAVAQLQQNQGYVPVSFAGHHPNMPRF